MPLKTILLICFCSIYSICFAQQPKLILPIGHTGQVSFEEFSQDGKLIISLSKDGTAKLWDAATGNLLNDFRSYNDASIALVTLARFSPDGKKIITGYEVSSSTIWNVKSGEPIWETLYSHIEAPVNTIMDHFSPDGKRIILFDFDNDGTVCNSFTKKVVFKLKGHKAKLSLACYSPDGKKIATAAEDSTVIIWDAVTGKKLTRLKKNANTIQALRFSADSKKIFIVLRQFDAYLKEHTEIADAVTGNRIADIDNFQSDYIDPFRQLSPDGKKFIEFSGLKNDEGFSKGYYFDTAAVWDVQTEKLFFYKTNISKDEHSFYFSPDGKQIVNITNNNTVEIVNAASGRPVFELTGHTGKITVTRFSPDGKKIITGSEDQTAKVWDATTGKLITELKGHTLSVTEARFSPDSKKIVTGSSDQTARTWDASTGKLITELKGHLLEIKSSRFNKDGKKIEFISGIGTQVWDSENGIFLNSPGKKDSILYQPDENMTEHQVYSQDSSMLLNWVVNIINIRLLQTDETILNFGVDELIRDVQMSPDNKYFLMTSKNNIVKLYDINKKMFVSTFFIIDSTNYIVQLPSGFYQSSQTAARLLHYVSKDLNVITFEQLDIKYNRPDKVLEVTGYTDTLVVNMFRNAYYKRIKKLSIDTTAYRDGYSVPEADFVNRNTILPEQKNETLSLQIKGLDSTYQLDRFNVWVNEVPLYGAKGKSIRKKSVRSLDITISITLSAGENRIETSVTNVNGMESYRMPLTVTYSPAVKQEEKTYFIGVGIDKFADANYNLQYSTKDIRDLTVKLQEKYGNNIIVDTLFNEKVTVSNVKALKQKLLQTTVNDKVIISYSGHGLLSKAYDYYLSTYSVNFNTPSENGLPYDELENLLDSIPARKKLMLIDACHSGEVDKDEFRQIEINKAVLDSNNVVSKGVIITSKTTQSKKLGLKNSFELMQSLFVNVGKSTGATIISAAAGTEFALEKGDLKNGVFTYCVMEAMDKYPRMKISELKKIVGARVELLTNGMQKPTSRNEAIAVDWQIW